jgi:YVTN family beta-propeller protein
MKKALTRIWLSALILGSSASGENLSGGYLICVSNEKSGTVSLIDSASNKVIETLPVGKRPRGIHGSRDGKYLYMALSGTPNQGPPQLDGKANPILRDDSEDADHSADGIGVIDLQQRMFVKKLPCGTDPEQFAVSRDGSQIYVSNEDVGTASVLNVREGKIENVIPVKEEAEGIAFTPDGKFCYVTCETRGEIVVIDTKLKKAVAEFTVKGRPRNVAFLPDGSRAFIPSETTGKIHVVETGNYETVDVIELPAGSRLELPAGSRPMDVVVSSDGKKLFVSNGRGGTISMIDAQKYELLNSIKVGVRPWGIALTPDDKFLYVANGPSNDVSVIDTKTGKEIARIKVGENPWGVAIVPAVVAKNPGADFN